VEEQAHLSKDLLHQAVQAFAFGQLHDRSVKPLVGRGEGIEISTLSRTPAILTR